MNNFDMDGVFERKMAVKKREKPLVALLTNHDDDIYCFRRELIAELRHSGYHVLISCPYGEKLELMHDIGFLHDDVSIDRRGTNPLTDIKLLLHYRKMFRIYRPDVVLAYTVKPNVYGSLAAASLGIPYINNVTGLGSILCGKRLMRRFVLILFKAAFRKSGCVFFQNEENMKFILKQGLVHGSYKLIPGSGVNTKYFTLQEYPEGGNGATGATVIFNYIGRVLHDKGVDDYIAAAKRIKKIYPKTEFNILGFIEPTEMHYEKELKELEKQGIIRYRGQQIDVIPFIKRSHAIIHPSTYGEGMSNVLLENASSGRPVITTDNPGCKETVRNKETGFIYHGGDVEALVRSIEQFLSLDNEERKLMGQAGRRYVKEHFSRSIVVEAYLDKIGSLIPKKRYSYDSKRNI